MIAGATLPVANLGHPLCQGLRGWWMAHSTLGGIHLPHMGPFNRPAVAGGTTRWSSRYGGSLYTDGTDGYVNLMATPFTGLSAVSVVWLGSLITAETFSRIVCNLDDAASTNSYFLAQSSTLAGVPRFVILNTSGVSFTAQLSTAMTVGNLTMLCGTAGPSLVTVGMNDLARNTTAVTGTVSLGVSTTTLRLGCSSSITTTNCTEMVTKAVLFYPNVELTDSQRLAIYDEARKGFPNMLMRRRVLPKRTASTTNRRRRLLIGS